MPIAFDPDKDRQNRARHDMSLADAERFDFDTAVIEEDRDSLHEQRLRAIGFVGGRLCFLVYTEGHDGTIRAISLRPATRVERRRYVQNLRPSDSR